MSTDPDKRQPYKYSQLRENIMRVYRIANGSRPEVLHVRIDEHDLVIKDYHPCQGVFGIVLGRFLVFREQKALRRLQGLAGVPRCYSCDSSRVLITSHCDAQVAADAGDEIIWDVFESSLYDLIGKIHRRGVVHCDLRSPGNILIDADSRPYLVDFVASFSKSRWNPFWNLLFDRARKADYSAVLKLKNRLSPELLNEHERLKVKSSARKGYMFRLISNQIRRFAQKILG